MNTVVGTQAVRVTAFDRVYQTSAPIIFRSLWLAASATTLSRSERRQRTGLVPEVSGRLFWFHGASAGEMAAALRLAALLRENGFAFTAGFTATNRAGVDFVRQVAEGPTVVALVPWDVPSWIATAFERWHPDVLFLVETELWPTLIMEAVRRGVPVFCVSGRVYPRDFKRYRAIRPFIGPVISRLTRILAQSDAERERFLELGASADQCVVSGNLKHLATSEPVRRSIDWKLGAHEKLVTFGSIHGDEIDFVVETIGAVRCDCVRYVIAPRHLGPVPKLVAKLRKAGWKVVQRTSANGATDWNVMVLDTIGELNAAYAGSSVAVIGGGFRKHGGHNLLEPLMAGVPVAIGHHFEHFSGEADQLFAVTPEAIVSSPARLADLLSRWLADSSQHERMLVAQRNLIPNRNAIASNYVKELKPWLQRIPA